MRKIALLLFSIISIAAMAKQTTGIAKGTIVTLADGVEVSIEEVKKDDMLLTLNAENNSVLISKVIKIHKGSTKELQKVVLADGIEIILSSNYPILSDNGWMSFDHNASKAVECFNKFKIGSYTTDTFVYSIDSEVKIEILPIIEIEAENEKTEVYRLELDNQDVAFIANGIFVGQ